MHVSLPKRKKKTVLFYIIHVPAINHSSVHVRPLFFFYYQCAENKELEEKIILLEHQLASVSGDNKPSPSENCIPDECADELRKKAQSQVNFYLYLLIE